MMNTNLEMMRKDMRAHSRMAPRVALRGAWIQMQRRRGGIRAASGATRYSASPGLGRPEVRQVRRGPQYPPRGIGEADRATRRYRHGQTLFITTQHPGGLLARGFRGVGFHEVAARSGRRAFQHWKWRRGEREGS